MNLPKLNQIVDNSGIKKKILAEKTGICPYTLTRKLTGVRKFEVDELNALANVLGATIEEKCEIFFS